MLVPCLIKAPCRNNMQEQRGTQDLLEMRDFENRAGNVLKEIYIQVLSPCRTTVTTPASHFHEECAEWLLQ